MPPAPSAKSSRAYNCSTYWERMRTGSPGRDRKSTRLNSSHPSISYAVFCLKKKKTKKTDNMNLVKNNRNYAGKQQSDNEEKPYQQRSPDANRYAARKYST